MFDSILQEINSDSPVPSIREIKEDDYYKETMREDSEEEELAKIDILETLNEEQYKSAISDAPNNLVIASAGTGKTSTIIGRVSYLLKKGVKPEEIIMLTFTAKAGKEMVERLAKLHGKRIAKRIFAGTFHAYGLLLLKTSNNKRKLKSPSDARALFDSIFYKYAKKHHIDTEEALAPATIYGYYNLYISISAFESSFTDFLDNKFQGKDEHQDFIVFYDLVVTEYEREKEKYRAMDFNDLLMEIKNHYEKNESKLVEVIVDEYQDTNYFQNKILEAMAKSSSLFCVGDYDQSIYAFNGSDVKIIGEFQERFPDSKVLGLVKNYRSSKDIINLAEMVIQNNERLFPKMLEATKVGMFPKPMLLQYKYENDQYEGVAEEISELVTSGIKENDIAVLYRSNSSGDKTETSLLSRGLNVDRVDSSSFFEAKDIAILISCFKILTSYGSVVDFIKMSKMIKECDEVELKRLYDNAVVLGDGNYTKGFMSPNFSEDNVRKLDEVSRDTISMKLRKANNLNVLDTISLNARELKTLKDFFDIFISVQGVQKPHVIFQEIYNTKFYKHFKDSQAKHIAKVARRDETEIKGKLTSKHETLLKISVNTKDIKSFLQKIIKKNKEEAQDGIKLLTIHASKGLEFDIVFIVDNVEEKFPNYKMANESGGGVEEERRLFFVAVTRARERLILTMPTIKNIKGKDKKLKPSIFLQEAQLL